MNGEQILRDRIRRRLLISVLACGGLFASAARADDAPAAASGPLRVLFIGNSLTYVNDLPAVLTHLSIASTEPRKIESDSYTMPSWTLERHWDAGRALDKISKGGRWDYVVLQAGQMKRPDAEKYVKLFDAEIRKTGAKTILYGTWQRKGVQDNFGRTMKIAESVGALIAPVAPAWEFVQAESDSTALYQPDGLHPTPAGTYIAGCVFFTVIYGKPPEGPGTSVVSQAKPADVALWQKAAATAVQTWKVEAAQ
jgi:hypothetical protein